MEAFIAQHYTALLEPLCGPAVSGYDPDMLFWMIPERPAPLKCTLNWARPPYYSVENNISLYMISWGYLSKGRPKALVYSSTTPTIKRIS